MGVIVRQMRLEDIEQVTKLAEQLGYPNTRDEVARRFATICTSKDHGLLVALHQLVAGQAASVVGWAQVNRETATLLSESRAEITALVVDESVRGQNIGKLLLGHAEQWAREQSLTIMRLRSNVKRTDAHRFYLREGYEIQKSWHLLVKELK